MTKNLKITPKVKQTLSGEKVKEAFEALTQYLSKTFDFNAADIALVGIQTRGATIAKRIAETLQAAKGVRVPFGALDITLYRDDFSTSGIQPIVKETQLNFDIDNKRIILIDDVLFTGRTIRAALDELMDFGRPQSITLAVLVDRGHRELPIHPDFSAITLSTKRHESVNLHLKETDNSEEIVICEPIGE